MNSFLQRLKISLPIIQAPMAGVSTPEMAAAVSNAGGLGSIGMGSTDAEGTRKSIRAVRALTNRPFQVNVFCHRPAVADPVRDAAWIKRLQPEFARWGAEPPQQLAEIYKSLLVDDDKLTVLLEERPAVVSFHFGLPTGEQLEALHQAGILMLATATTLSEADAIVAAGMAGVIAQGYEAGGHRGMFDPAARDPQFSTLTLTRLFTTLLNIPVIAAGGIMDGAGIAAALKLGASAAQLGTAFIGCPESAADSGYREALFNHTAGQTTMTTVISGRPARCLNNRFVELGTTVTPGMVPDYPLAYSIGKELHAAAKARSDPGYGAYWAGQGACMARFCPVEELMAVLASELQAALHGE